MTKEHDIYRAAASKAVMRSVRYFAQFTVLDYEDMFFGVIQPGWDVERGDEAEKRDGHCFYDTLDGRCYPGRAGPGRRDWEGMQNAQEQGDRISMLLDLDQGSMTVWKDDVRLGVMVAEGLRGPLCWAVSLYYGAARIESAPILAALESVPSSSDDEQ